MAHLDTAQTPQLNIYTKNPIVNETEEHIILNALGGRITARDLIDVATNGEFGSTIDVALANTIHLARTLTNALSGDGNPPPVYREVPGEDGVLYDIRPDGKVEISTPRLDVKRTEDGLQIDGTVRNKPELQRLLARPFRAAGIDISRVAEIAKYTETPMPQMTFNMQFTPDGYRAIAKMACNLFARTCRESFLHDDFDSIRNFVAKGSGDYWDFVAANTEPVDICDQGRRLGILDHHILITSKNGEVSGLVTLFEHLQFIVRIGRHEGLANVATSYRVDQIGRRHRIDDLQDTGMKIPAFARIAAATEEEAIEATARARDRLVPVLMQEQKRLAEEAKSRF